MPDGSPTRRLFLHGASIEVFADAAGACRVAGDRIAAIVGHAVADRGRAALGLATGATPRPVYERLVSLYRARTLSFEQVSTFNLDEYYPISPVDPRSYHVYMQRHLFDHVNLAPNRAHVLDGTVPEASAAHHAADFDAWIADEGGLDVQLLGIGRNGHIGFNEPNELPLEDALKLPTRLVDLHPTTRGDAAREFGTIDRVPTRALTVGVASILAARTILVLAFGPNKADAVAQSLLGPATGHVPASLLQAVGPHVVWMLDEPAARELV